jgi:predicted aldo/keto reductase-like oxidoreductase
VVCGVSGQGVGGPTERGDVECGICVERCPFDVDILAKTREAAEIFEEYAA